MKISTEKRKKLLNYMKEFNDVREKDFWNLLVDFLTKNQNLSKKQKEEISKTLKENFYSVLDKMHYTEYELLKVKAKANKEELERIQEFRARSIKKKPGKKPKKWIELELKYKYLIKQLRDKKLSWREISEYLRKYHKKKYSPAYLMRFYKQNFED